MKEMDKYLKQRIERKKMYDSLMTRHPSYKAYRNQDIELKSYPFKVRIEPTNYCDMKCKICPQSSWENSSEKGYINLNLFREIIDKLKGKVEYCGLFLGGEPLIHPDIVEMVRIANAAQLRPYFHTNGLALTEKKSEQLIKAGLDYISFSFEGVNRKKYESVRKGTNYDVVLNNISTFLRIKKDYDLDNPYTVIEVLDYNAPYITKEFKNLFCGLPVNELNLIKTHTWTSGLSKPDNSKYVPCRMLWDMMIIGWDGTVSPCCFDIKRKMKMGNIKGKEILEIWNNKKFITMREKIIKMQYKDLKLCATCQMLFPK